MSDYETDVYAWSLRQGALLRRLAAGERVNDADLDWPNIAEEIETVGRSERAAVASHIANIIEHLIKLEASPATGVLTITMPKTAKAVEQQKKIEVKAAA
jgi:hypothetical protein